ncbi:MAG TPA: hypothetical protein PKO06_16855, partial [Candidatus Ozemobacteraceae bacterium]|nr:hypothetical protein [Candidatus Ozemobacteraceae bacterium]
AEPPLLALSGTFEGTAPASVVPSRTLTPQEKAVAEACLIEASRLIDRGSDAKALDWLRRAHAAAPGEPRYADALRIHENQIAARSSLRVLEDKLRAGKADEAWEEYLSKALHDRFYFLSTASRWSRILDRHGQTASAGSVLRTYLTCKPTDLSAQQRYQRLLIRLGCLSGV